MAMHLVRRVTLANLLDVTDDTLYEWDRQGFLPAFGAISREIHYDAAQVDRFLQEHARNFANGPPTLRDLQEGRLTLVGTAVAATQLDVTQAYVWELIHTGRLAAVRYTQEYRVSLQSVQAHIAARDDNLLPTFAIASRVLGVSSDTLDVLVASGRLVDASDGYRRRVTRASLLRLLSQLVPNTDPRNWLSDRLASEKPLLTVSDAALNPADKQQLRRLVAAGRLQYINHPTAVTPGKQQLILPESHLRYLERTQQALRRQDMAVLFATTLPAIDDWLAQGLIACPLHDHYRVNWYETCAVKVLARYVTQGSSPHRWFKGVRGGSQILSVEDAAHILKTTPHDVQALVDRGELHGLRKPNRSLVFMRYQVIGYRDRHRRNRRACDE